MSDENDDRRRFIESDQCRTGINLLWELSKKIDDINFDNNKKNTIVAIINILERNRKKIVKDSRSNLLKFKTKIINNEDDIFLNKKDFKEVKIENLEYTFINEFKDNLDEIYNNSTNFIDILSTPEVKLISNRNDTGSWDNPIPNVNGRPYDFFERKIFDKYVDYWENSKLSVPFSDWGDFEDLNKVTSITSIGKIEGTNKGCKSIQEAVYKIRKFEQDLQNVPKEIIISLIESGILINNKREKKIIETKQAKIKDLNDNNIYNNDLYFKVPQSLFFKMVINEHNDKSKFLDKNKDTQKTSKLIKNTNLISNQMPSIGTSTKECDCDFYKVKQKFMEKYDLYNFSNNTLKNISINKEKNTDSNLRLWMGAYSLPRNDKRINGGEDGWFVAENTQCMGVADGVGEWEDLSGTSARKFSNCLMQNSLKYIQENIFNKSLEKPSLLAKDALKQSLLICEENGIHGASTALILCFDYVTGTIGFANMGDSGAVVLRRLQFDTGKMEIVRRVKEMQHDFNCPYQFANLPPEKEWPELLEKGYHDIVRLASLEKESKKKDEYSSLFACDNPELSQLLDVQVKEGDLIILGTDGLFDNLFDFEISSISGLTYSPVESKLFYKNLEFTTTPMVIAKSIALSAYYKSLDPFTKTPFASQAKKFHSGNKNSLISNQMFAGGKEDDITVLVAWVVSKEDLDVLTRKSPYICDVKKKI